MWWPGSRRSWVLAPPLAAVSHHPRSSSARGYTARSPHGSETLRPHSGRTSRTAAAPPLRTVAAPDPATDPARLAGSLNVKAVLAWATTIAWLALSRPGLADDGARE